LIVATQVTPAMLSDAARKATEVGEGITGQLTNLLHTIQTQGAASFRGGGGTSFQQVSQQLSHQLHRLLAALNTMASNVDASNVAFGSTDADVSREINQVGGMYAPGGGNIVDALRG
jgi:WXG100 family type VII secretion target